MHLLELPQPYLLQSLVWKTDCQFDQSPIIAIAQIFMENRGSLRKGRTTQRLKKCGDLKERMETRPV